MAPKTKRYEKKDPISHCLDRPDMYVGSVRLRNNMEYIAQKSEDNEGKWQIFQQEINSSPAILRIFIEALSNAVDNVERSKSTSTPCTTIKVTINEETGETSIWNDGDVVPIEMNEEEKCYNHTMIFGQLLTGSNYDDEEERVTAGRNGLGIKLVSIFSKNFQVEGCDPSKKLILTQNWTDNMRKPSEPILKTSKLKGYTKVTWTPDFSRFGLTKYTPDIIKLYNRYVIDAAMISKIKVYLNGELIPVTNLSQYAELFTDATSEKLLIKTNSCDVLVTPSKSYQPISFVNGIYTRLGGQHVDSWAETIFRPIVDKINGKDKKQQKLKTPKISIADVKQFFRLFVVATVVRPEFNGQEKEKLESPPISSEIKTTQLSTIYKWSVMESIEDILKSKEMGILKKVEKKKKFVKIDGMDQANNSGSKYSSDCSLFICEGLSAKTYVVAGIDTGVYGKQGRDWFGILPITGKVLNVRNATPTSIANNKVIVSFIQALGLQHGLNYTEEKNFKTLNYGKVILIADADDDGLHIESLLINLIHHLFPSLLERTEPFITSMKTPIVRIFRQKTKDLLFYDERRFQEYTKQQTQKINIKYYKGLGTTRAEDVPDTFGHKMIEYVKDELCSENMNKIFNKKNSDERKKWLGEYDGLNYAFCLDDQEIITKMSISDFLNYHMIKFSLADCKRSIPNGIDGLKESQRKILYSVFKRNLKFSGKSLKVAQLSGYTAEHSNYHHGEQNLQDTIIYMAHDFPGTNNIPLLYPDGGFGTRLENGHDAASARYIYTKMEGMTEKIFRSEDFPLLNYVNDDGDLVQPEYYVPIIPMILVNGCNCGIGTGWSCNIPCYNPKDLINCIKIWIQNDGEIILDEPNTNEKLSLLPELIPWYRGYKGEIKPNGKNKFISSGIIQPYKKNKIQVTELPIGMWTNKFKEFCEDLVIDKKLKDISNYSSPDDVNFILTESEDGIKCNINNLKLQTHIYTTNMVLFTENDQLKKYDTIDEIINNFCQVRLDLYKKRKKYQIKMIEKELRHLCNKERFITEVVNDKIIIVKRKQEDIVNELQQKNFDEDSNGGGYNYLLSMQLRTLTQEKIEELQNEIKSLQNKLKIIISTSEENMWLKELQELETHYEIWLKDIDKRTSKIKK